MSYFNAWNVRFIGVFITHILKNAHLHFAMALIGFVGIPVI